jgi:hypothetical protein
MGGIRFLGVSRSGDEITEEEHASQPEDAVDPGMIEYHT